MAENADTASLSPAREARRAPSKRRRASSLPSDSGHEPAREAQQPAQPDEPPRDENTLDLFAGDPTHAPVQTVETGRRRSKPSGAERSRPVRSADEADEVDAAEQTAEMLPVAAVAPPLAESKPADGEVGGKAGDERAAEVVAPATDVAQSVVAVETNAATVANVPEVAPAKVEAPVAEPMLPGQALAQVRTARATAAQRPKVGWAAAHTAAADAVSATASATATVATTAAAAVPAAADTSRTVQPEPDQARAAASPNTVDALDGLITSQRRASADLSRRMRRMLGAAVGALALTVAAAIAQTMMLSRVAANARAQELRLTQMMAEQQAAFAAALARLPAQSAAPAAVSAAQAVPQSVARPAAPVPAHRTRRAAAHGHRAHPVSR